MEKSTSSRPKKQEASASNSATSDQHTKPPQPAIQTKEYSNPPNLPQTPHLGNTRPQGPKVAIPRLPRPSAAPPSSKSDIPGDKNRVGHACEPCRHRKTKCSGERPACQHCQDFKLACNYMDGKRDKTKKQLGDLVSRVENYERLLEELSLRAGGSDQDLIRRALDKVSSSDEDDTDQRVFSSRGRKVSQSAGENKVTARVGSTESLDRISEDFNRDANTRATGFHGKNSELTWMQRLKRQASHGSDDDEAYDQSLADGLESPAPKAHHFGDRLTPINNSSYHCDDLGISVDVEVDPFYVPDRVVADDLFQNYLCTVHPMFPIIGKSTFIQQYNVHFSRPSQRNPNANWMAILNMIFAIGAKYSEMGVVGPRSGRLDHLIYFTRARMLAFNADAILGHADLQKIQVTGLMAFYLLAINQINRSWMVSGFAIRHASTLGLNLRNESKSVSDASKEIRYRVWWALCTIEDVLAVMTGRLTSYAETDCTLPLPLPMEEDTFIGSQTQNPQAMLTFRRWSSEDSRKSENAMPTPASSSHSTRVKASPGTSLSPAASQVSSEDRRLESPPTNAFAFRYSVRLSTITNSVLNRLYRAGTMSESWAQVQASIANLDTRLEDWRHSLPPIFDFTRKQRDQQFVRQRMSLGFSYYSSLTIVNRPCLCRIDRNIPDESDKSKSFNRETAAKCVNAARGMLGLLPDEPNARGLYKIAPWWILVHYLMQAATVLMLELAFRADHMPNEVEEVFDAAKKALQWLRSMSEDDEAARRASVMCNGLLRQVAPKVGRDPNEVLNPTADGHAAYVDGVNPIEGAEQVHDVLNFNENSAAYQPRPQYDFTTSGPFQPNMFAHYDQMNQMIWPASQMPPTSVAAPYDGMLFDGNEMGGMGIDDNDPLGYSSGPEQRWFPGSGA